MLRYLLLAVSLFSSTAQAGLESFAPKGPFLDSGLARQMSSTCMAEINRRTSNAPKSVAGPCRECCKGFVSSGKGWAAYFSVGEPGSGMMSAPERLLRKSTTVLVTCTFDAAGTMTSFREEDIKFWDSRMDGLCFQ
jgi:hypothetical protein